jgi:hypothetical protein
MPASDGAPFRARFNVRVRAPGCLFPQTCSVTEGGSRLCGTSRRDTETRSAVLLFPFPASPAKGRKVIELCYNVRVSGFRTNVRWTGCAWGLGAALSGAALVRAWRPERSTVDIAVTAATPWLLAPSCVLLGGALLTRRRSLVVLAGAFHF